MAFRFSAAVVLKPDGSIKTLYVGPDADAAKRARNDCDEPGEVGTIMNARAGSLKKNKGRAPEPKPAAKRVKPRGK